MIGKAQDTIVEVPFISKFQKDTFMISASQFSDDACHYQMLLHRLYNGRDAHDDKGHVFVLPESCSVIGSIVHSIFCDISRGKVEKSDFEDEFDQRLNKYNQESLRKEYPFYTTLTISPDYDDVDEFIKVANNIKVIAKPGDSTPDSQSGVKRMYGPEIWVEADYMCGYIDRVDKIDTDSVKIIDYKSGKNLYEADGKIKQVYINQLNIYAIAYEKQFNLQVKQLSIVDRCGNEIPVQIFNNDEREKLTAEIKKLSEKFTNNRSSLTFNIKRCDNCNLWHLCSKMKENRLRGNYIDVKGKVQNINKIGNISILSLTNEKYEIVPNRIFTNLQVGDFIAVSNLRLNSSTSTCTLDKNSVFFKLDPSIVE